MRFAVLTAGLLALAALPALADDKSPSQPKADAKHKYVEFSRVVGKLDKVNAGTQELTLEYMVGLGRYAKKEKQELTLADEVKVWSVKPPDKVEEGGERKKMTPQELDKIKSRSGDTRGWYAVDAAYLRPGQTVQVTLGKPKEAGPKPKAGEKEFVYVTRVVITDEPPAKPEKKK